MQTISIVGLGKLGSPFLATCASRGFNVIGIDVNDHLVKLINQGKTPVDEPGLEQLIAKNRRKIKATSDYNEAINNSDITFIIVPTPSTLNGAFSNEYIVSAVRKIGKILAKKDKFHLVVVTSTIMPKSMNIEIIPALEKASGKRLNKDFGICYNPEFIALGSVIVNLLNPDFVLIGESDKKSGRILESFYRKFNINKPPIVRTNFVNAEIAKIALNSYITTKISFANTLAQICEKVPGGDVDQVTQALGLDSRIGNKYLKGALPYGGPCFPRDNRAFSSFAKEVGVQASLAKATDLVNENMIAQIVKKVEKTATNKNSKIAILGLAYKPNTDVAEESAGVKIANLLSQKKNKVYVWDPKAMSNAKILISSKVTFARSMRDCLTQADVIIIATDWPEFINIKPSDLKVFGKKPILLDCCRMLDRLKYQDVAQYRAIGLESFKIGR